VQKCGPVTQLKYLMSIDYLPPPGAACLRRWRVPKLWGRISYEMGRNQVQGTGRGSLAEELQRAQSMLTIKQCLVIVKRCSPLVQVDCRFEEETEEKGLVNHPAGYTVKQSIKTENKNSVENSEVLKQPRLSKAHGYKSDFKCPKCDSKFPCRKSHRCHVLAHYYHVFADVFPSRTSHYSCPVCNKACRNKIDAIRHYAYGHRMIFELTELTPEDIYGKKGRKRGRQSYILTRLQSQIAATEDTGNVV